jgi:hypothetical protein
VTPETAEIIAAFKGGKTVHQIAAERKMTYAAVYYRLYRAGVIEPHIPAHPLTRNAIWRMRSKVGNPVDLPEDVADRIAATVAKHGCTVWGAVAILLRRTVETCDTKHPPKGPTNAC